MSGAIAEEVMVADQFCGHDHKTQTYLGVPMNLLSSGSERCITRQVSGPVFYTRQVRAQNAADQNLANIHP